jgi:hypothetical protein
MKTTTLLLCIIALSACGTKHSDAERRVYERTASEARMMLRYPASSRIPPIDSVRLKTKGDSIFITMEVQASNAFGALSPQTIVFDFKVDTCEHLVGGYVFSDKPHAVEPDPADRPCSEPALRKWEVEQSVKDIEEFKKREKEHRDSLYKALGLPLSSE